jgi:hypothetical protein
MYFVHPSNMNKPREEDDCEWGSIVFQKYPYPMLKEAARPNDTRQIGAHEDEEGGDDGKVERSIISQTLQDLDSLLKIDASNIKSKNVARKPGDPTKPVA